MRKLVLVALLSAISVTGCGQVMPLLTQGQSPLPGQATPTLETSAPLGSSPTDKPGTSSQQPTAATTPLAPVVSTAIRPSVGTAPTVKPNPKPVAWDLKVTSPQDESVVNVASIAIEGQAGASSVVSVNGDLVDVDGSGKFRTTVELEEGPNIIEIVASDTTGKEASTILTVIYQP